MASIIANIEVFAIFFLFFGGIAGGASLCVAFVAYIFLTIEEKTTKMKENENLKNEDTKGYKNIEKSKKDEIKELKYKDIIKTEYVNKNLINLFKGENKKPIMPDKFSAGWDKVDFSLIVYWLNVMAEKDDNVQKEINKALSEMVKGNYKDFYCAFNILWVISFHQGEKRLKVNNEIKNQLYKCYRKCKKNLQANTLIGNYTYLDVVEDLNKKLSKMNKETLL